MARVVSWAPQFAGAGATRAGWPGSNGSVTGTNATAAEDAPVATAVLAALDVAPAPAVAPVLDVAPAPADAPVPGVELEPLQAARTPTAAAETAASASPRLTALLPPAPAGRPLRDWLMTLLPAPGPACVTQTG